jgi:hypothetical protein
MIDLIDTEVTKLEDEEEEMTPDQEADQIQD